MDASRYILLLLLIPLLPMIISDFYRRKVALIWLIMLAACAVLVAVTLFGVNIFMINLVFNIAILIYMFLGVLLYVYIKNKKISSVKHYTGMGDALFFIALTPVFESDNFIYFLIASCLVSLAWWSITYVIIHKKRTVPLVGISGCLLSVYVALKVLI
ncbi:MAG: hypothetical protein LBJ63_08860 [Prevotellaceae bacterium]|jgi:hypothetical protein|nr:hypothetical protein [Prevotellaceae bacterium]